MDLSVTGYSDLEYGLFKPSFEEVYLDGKQWTVDIFRPPAVWSESNQSEG